MSAARLLTLLAAASAAVLACGGDDPCESVAGPAVVATVDLSPDDPGVALGQSLQLVAVPRSACGNRVADANVAWSSGTPAVASVSPAGMVTGEGLGTAIITASSEGVSASVTVSVTPPQVASVEVVPGEATIAVSETVTLAATARDGEGNVLTGRTVTWSSSNSGVASVTSAGVVTGQTAGGPVEITATVEGVEGTASITVDPVPGPDLVFQVQPQDGSAGDALAAVRVAVVDAQGEVITNDPGDAITIALGANPGGATLGGTLEVKPVNGVAEFDDLTLDKAAAGYTLVASRADAGPGTSAAFAIAPGAPAALVFGTDPGNTAAGAQLRPIPAVRVTDAFGNLVPVDGRNVTAGLAANPAGGTLSGTLTAATVGGVASFADLSLDLAGAGYALSATSTGLVPAASATFAITPGPAAALRFVQQPTGAAAGEVLAPPVTIAIVDAFGNATGTGTAQVSLALTNAGGAALGGTTARAAVAGVATFDNLTVSLPGDFTLTAAATGLTGTESESFRILAGVPTRLAFRVQPTDVAAGASITPAIEVVILDGAGNLTADQRRVTLTLATNPGGADLGGTTARDANDGVATFGNITVNRSGIGYRLAASADGLTGATSDAFDVAAGSVASLEFTAQPLSGTAGLPIAPVVVTLRDAAGNVVIGASGAVTVSLGTNPTGAPLQGTLSATPVAGIATFADLQVDVAGTGYRLNAVTAGVDPEGSATFNIQPNLPVKLRYLGATPNPREDRTINPPVQVAVSDAFNNTVPVAGVSVAIALGQNPVNATLSGTLLRGTTAGIATFNDLRISRDGQGFTLVADSPPLTPAETAPFTVRN
jgi:hypothetical protein